MSKSRIFIFAIIAVGVIGGIGLAKYVLENNTPTVITRFLPSPPPSIVELQNTFSEVAKFASPSIVHITRKAVVADEFFPFWELENEAVGSGVIVSNEGHIVTNNHVVSGATNLKVKFVDGREFDGKVIGADEYTDLAVIKIVNPPKDIVPAALGDSDQLNVGDWVLAIGSPYGLDHTVTAGIVSAKGRKRGISIYEDYIQTDAAINPGNSGGALVNIEGKVVGINTAIVTKSGAYSGIGLAIPVNIVKWVKDELIKKGKVRRGYIGAEMYNIDEDLVKRYSALGDIKSVNDLLNVLKLKDASGAFVSSVVKTSPAEKAGLKEGDVITEYSGEKVQNADKLRFMIGQTEPGTAVALKVVRAGKEKELTATIIERPDERAPRRRR